MKLKNIKIRILGTGINDACQVCVSIFNSCGDLVYEGLTYNGCIYVNLCACEGYIITIRGCVINKREVFYVDKYTSSYTFNTYELNSGVQNVVTFQLLDFFYNLPIMKGELTLWQKQ